MNSQGSDDAAAWIRGVEVKKVPGKFVYTNCLGRPYGTTLKNIKSVTFDTTRFGNFVHTIEFNPMVNEKQAIEAAENYLSQPLTQQYYEIRREYTFHKSPWEEAKRYFTNRGDSLTDLKFLEVLRLKDGNLRIECGS